MMQWLRKRAVKANPGAINEKAWLVLGQLGEPYHESVERQPGEVLPPKQPRHGKRFDAGRLSIVSNHRFLTVTWDDKPVYEHDLFKTRRLNYGEDWLAELNDIYDDLQSKDQRGHAARWRDL